MPKQTSKDHDIVDQRQAPPFQRQNLTYHLKTLWLFTRNDLKSILIPEVAFGVFSALSGSSLTTNPDPQVFDIVSRLPEVIVWNWANLLLFDIANQRLPHSIVEDTVNKPWRPLPSQRLTEAQSRRLLLAILPVVFLVSLITGSLAESVVMMALTWMYNDLGGADENYLVRNLINACGFVCYSSGSTRVAAGHGSYDINDTAYAWLAIVGGIVFSTLQMQDMADMKGDAARGRRTLPLVHGESVARWSIALPVAVWSLVCPMFWCSDVVGYVFSLTVGMLVVLRVLLLEGAAPYRVTWGCWCLWTTILYLLPLLKDLKLPKDALTIFLDSSGSMKRVEC